MSTPHDLAPPPGHPERPGTGEPAPDEMASHESAPDETAVGGSRSPGPGPGPEAPHGTAAAPLPPTGNPAPGGRWRRAGARGGRVLRHRVTLVVLALLVGGGIGAGATAAVVGHGGGPHVGPRGSAFAEHGRGGGHGGGGAGRGGDHGDHGGQVRPGFRPRG
jgi:hypothetical protein